jgi:hypothetical protein
MVLGTAASAAPALAGVPFVVAGVLKLVYDGLLQRPFRREVPLPEGATRRGGGICGEVKKDSSTPIRATSSV